MEVADHDAVEFLFREFGLHHCLTASRRRLRVSGTVAFGLPLNEQLEG